MQLRYNVSQIEEFLSRRNMREGPIIKELNPLVQSSQLMQVKKQDENDAKLLLQMCDSLTGAQVRPILCPDPGKHGPPAGLVLVDRFLSSMSKTLW